jgi:hypothetical protein
MSALPIVGALTGSLSLLVSFLVYLRDAPRVRVVLRCDLSSLDEFGKLFCVLTVFNAGRRSIYLQQAHIPPLVKGGKVIIFKATAEAIQLAEGSQPYRSQIDQADIAQSGAARFWWRMRVKVWDAAGRAYHSRWLIDKPSFASEDAPPVALLVSRMLNAWADFRLRLLA